VKLRFAEARAELPCWTTAVSSEVWVWALVPLDGAMVVDRAVVMGDVMFLFGGGELYEMLRASNVIMVLSATHSWAANSFFCAGEQHLASPNSP